MELREFLTARLADDERIALAVQQRAPWVVVGSYGDEGVKEDGYGWVATGAYNAGMDADDAAHIARHDPARVLRDVAAKRRILEMWEDPADVAHLPDGVVDGRDPDERDEQIATASVIDVIVRDLAAVYAEHPDYRQEWAT